MSDEILSALRRLEGQIERLDAVVRGTNGEGLTARLARIDASHQDHARRILDAEGRVGAVERRVMWFAGAAAAIGALLPTVVGRWI